MLARVSPSGMAPWMSWWWEHSSESSADVSVRSNQMCRVRAPPAKGLRHRPQSLPVMVITMPPG